MDCECLCDGCEIWMNVNMEKKKKKGIEIVGVDKVGDVGVCSFGRGYVYIVGFFLFLFVEVYKC